MKNISFFFDLDGTLLSHEGELFQADTDAMAAVHKEGARLFMNTGRAFANIPEAIITLPFWSGAACGTGAHVLARKDGVSDAPASTGRASYQTIVSHAIDTPMLEAICEWYLRSKQCMVFEGETHTFIIAPPARLFKLHDPIEITDPRAFSTSLKGERVTKLTIEHLIDDAERDFLAPHFQLNPFPAYTEAVLPGMDKATAMDALLAAFDAPLEKSAACGDSLNDMAMIRHAALGIAVGNACDPLKAAAKLVVSSSGNGAVADTIAAARCQFNT